MSRLRHAPLLAAALAGCFQLHPDDGRYACETSAQCPSGYQCASDHSCRRSALPPPPDQALPADLPDLATRMPLDSGPGVPVDMARCVPLTACPPSVGCGTIGDGCGGTLDCGGACQLTALAPPIAQSGAVVTLEGTFGTDVTVHFAGSATPRAATVLGAHRAHVVVPDDATAGPLTVTSGGATVGGAFFRRVPFTLGLGTFRREYEQTDVARQMPPLDLPRIGQSTLAVQDDHVYVIGGNDADRNALGSVLRATINVDGTLSAFRDTGVVLGTPRMHAAAVNLSGTLYVLGGDERDLHPVDTIEQGDAQNLVGFAPAAVKLTRARAHFATAVVGHYLYVLGGADADGAMDSVERAPIGPDGVLGPFADASLTLTRPRHGPNALVIGDWLYVIGGDTWPGDVERAAILPDGSLGPFAKAVELCGWSWDQVSLALGDSLYVIGGSEAPQVVQQASIQPDGSLSAFDCTGARLRQERIAGGAVIAGTSLYLLGGDGFFAPGTVERASLNKSGMLAPFATSSVQMSWSRDGFVSAVLGHWLYTLGGENGTRDVDGEAAGFGVDGRLTDFPRSLTTGVRQTHSSAAVVGSGLYLIGGEGKSVKRFHFDDDGSIGQFRDVGPLVAARACASSFVVRDALYVVGGYDQFTVQPATPRVERAAILADGTLGPFQDAGIKLPADSCFHRTAVLGDHVYILGGDTVPAGVVQSATIADDGTLSDFVVVKSVTLAFNRHSQALAAVGDSLYVMGGANNAPAARAIEIADIGADGTVDFFGTSTNTMANPHGFAQAELLGGSLLYVFGSTSDLSSIGSVDVAALQ